MRKAKWLLLLILAFLPQIAASRFGKPLLIRALESKTNSRIEIDALHLSWLGPQRFERVRWSQDQITGTIEEAEIAAPFGLFPLEKCKANGTVDFGQIEYHNEKTIAAIASLLNRSETKQVKAWFTPAAFRLEKGVLTIGRIDALLANAVHLCGWGSIDLSSDQLHMTLGLPTDTLETFLGLHHLSENYVLEIDIRGTKEKPEIVKESAAIKIAALTAKQAKKGLLKDLAELLTQGQPEAAPPPASRPFPWENL